MHLHLTDGSRSLFNTSSMRFFFSDHVRNVYVCEGLYKKRKRLYFPVRLSHSLLWHHKNFIPQLNDTTPHGRLKSSRYTMRLTCIPKVISKCGVVLSDNGRISLFVYSFQHGRIVCGDRISLQGFWVSLSLLFLHRVNEPLRAIIPCTSPAAAVC